MVATAQIDFVLGGKLLSRQMPAILSANPKASARRNNRTMTQKEWNQFCDDFEASMSWSQNWREFLLTTRVVLSLSLTLSSVFLLIISNIWLNILLEHDQYKNNEGHQSIKSYNITYNHESHRLNSRPFFQSFLRDSLPVLCAFMLFITATVLSTTIIQVSSRLQDAVKQVCYDYTERYQPYHGITFAVSQQENLEKRNHSRQSAHSSLGWRPKHFCLVVTKRHEELSGSYHQSTSTSHATSGAPFFDVRPDNLLPPTDRFSSIHIPRTCNESVTQIS